ncbi:MAG: glycosyltransferase [Clostridium sp.]|nr:glycosyltransferase [Clostridium sp.]
MKPLFSIITVTYNAEKTLPVTMESVAAQKCRLFEHIVQDGQSKDRTVDIARRMAGDETVIVSERDSGIYDAMNKAMGRATGDYLIFLNAGDTFHSPDTLSHFADAILANDYPGVVYGQTDIVDSRRRRIAPRHLTAPESLSLESFAEGMTVCHQAFCALRKITGAYDLRYRYSADYDWCIRCLQHSRHNIYLPEVVIDYLDEGTTTANRRASLKERFLIMSYYYGFWPTLLRHIGFIPRFLKRRKTERQIKASLTN